MADALTTITNLINSPPGQLAAGAALAGIVWKFFQTVESTLTDDTKLEIGLWLLDQESVVRPVVTLDPFVMPRVVGGGVRTLRAFLSN